MAGTPTRCLWSLQLGVVVACTLAGHPGQPKPVTVNIDWSNEKVRTHTAATIEVDVMPFLGRTDFGGPFNAYYEALSNLGSEYVRYAPWFANPRAVVPELTPPDCTAKHPATNWNSTYFDGIMRDFMAAVCGPDAHKGLCKKSVVQQLSTMPSWMYVGGYCPDASVDCLPSNPWNTTDPFSLYANGGALVDKTCGQMARYVARIVGWYTAGGFHDDCGHWHESGFNYSWWGLSVLNEDEHHIQPDNGAAYVICYDAIVQEVAKVNPKIVPVGPEIAGNLPYLLYFLDPAHHTNGIKPAVSSYHQAMFADNGTAANFFTQWDAHLRDYVVPVEDFKKEKGITTEMVLNEYIPFQNDWCDCDGVEHLCGGERFPARCPDWQKPELAGGDPNLQHAKGIGMNKRTWSYHAAGAVFAYGYATLAEYKYKYVGQDQLIGGTWPDNEPGVSCLDWQSGQPNAKYWVTNLLATTVGDSSEKAIFHSEVHAASPPPPPVGLKGQGTCGLTNYDRVDCNTSARGAWNTTLHGITSLDACVAKAQKCKMGNFVSFSLQHEDCSWYSTCDMKHLDIVGSAHYVSEVVRSVPAGDAGSAVLHAMPYSKNGSKGLLLVSKVPDMIIVNIRGVTGGLASVVEVTPGDPETALTPPKTKVVSEDGLLPMGPFGVAVITELQLH